jgi:hypothetical protein
MFPEEDSYALYCDTVNDTYVEQSTLLNGAAGDQVLVHERVSEGNLWQPD